MIRFGPAGLGPVKDAIERLEEYNKAGIKACEIAFTYGVYIKNKEDAINIGKKAQELGIRLSIHAPYWINLNSREKRKVEESKARLVACCEIGEHLGAYRIVFHPGFYGGMEKDATYSNIKAAMDEVQETIRKNKWKVQLAPETTGKINVFGSVDEILRLAEETKCSFTIDFAHILAREKKVDFETILKKFSGFNEFHIHFSGIEYGEKGERRHIRTDEKELKGLIENIKKYLKRKEVVVINESPYPIEDSIRAIRLL